MFSNHKSNLIFIYVQCIVTAIIAFVYSDIFFDTTNTVLQIIVYLYLVCALLVWLAFGHFNDIFFNLSSVIGFVKIYNNIGKVKYILDTSGTHCFYYVGIDGTNMYNIYLKGGVVTCVDRKGNTYFMVGEHPFITLQSILHKKIKKSLTELYLHTTSFNDDDIFNLNGYQIAKQVVIRNQKINSVLN